MGYRNTDGKCGRVGGARSVRSADPGSTGGGRQAARGSPRIDKSEGRTARDDHDSRIRHASTTNLELRPTPLSDIR